MTHEYLSRRSFLTVRELAGEMSVAEIAALTKLTPQTVVAILAGERQPSRVAVDDDHPLREEMLTATRCPGCGALVFAWPCLGCEMTAGGHGANPVAGRIEGSLLKQKRYRSRVARQRSQTGAAPQRDVA